MRYALGVLFFIAGIVIGAYVAVYVLFVGGIVEVINGIKADPTDAHQIAGVP
jgi:hypothetical protein